MTATEDSRSGRYISTTNITRNIVLKQSHAKTLENLQYISTAIECRKRGQCFRLVAAQRHLYKDVAAVALTPANLRSVPPPTWSNDQDASGIHPNFRVAVSFSVEIVRTSDGKLGAKVSPKLVIARTHALGFEANDHTAICKSISGTFSSPHSAERGTKRKPAAVTTTA